MNRMLVGGNARLFIDTTLEDAAAITHRFYEVSLNLSLCHDIIMFSAMFDTHRFEMRSITIRDKKLICASFPAMLLVP